MTELNEMTEDALKAKLTELKTKLESIPPKWSKPKSISGRCAECYDHEDKSIIKLGEQSYCKEHYSDYNIKHAKEDFEKEIKSIADELDFRTKLEKAVRFSQMKDMVIAVRAIIKRERDRGYGHNKTFGSEEKDKAVKLLRLLNKIKPKSSPFLDRGIAINEDLFLAGTIIQKRYDSGHHTITLTALDQDERYKAIARVELSIKEAERLRSLLTDCIEHVRIAKMMNTITENMKIELEHEDDWDDEEDD